MYLVSEQYKQDIGRQLRNESFMRIRFGITDPQAKDASVISDTSSLPYSDSSSVKIETSIPRTYDTLEHNKFMLDTAHILATEGYGDYQGYVSAAMSRSDRTFEVPPQMLINYSGYFEFAGFTLEFDEVRNDFPSEFRVQCFYDSTEVFNKLVTTTTYNVVVETAIPLHNSVIVTFLKTVYPYRRVRLHYLAFGIIKNLTDSTITSTTWNKKVDLLSTVLPKGDFEFTFLDVDNEYNPENPNGLYAYLEQLQPVKFEYGYELSDGSVEWVLGGNNYTTGEVSISSSGKISQVTFKTTNTLAYLTDIYKKGTYYPLGISLYDLAEDVLSGTQVLYELSTDLQSIYTTAPMPKLPIRECLQLIANAGRCVLDVGRDGRIRIQRPSFAQDDFYMDFGDMYDTPTVKKIPPLKNLLTTFYNYIPNVSSETISEINVSGASSTNYYFEYEKSTDVSLTVDAGLTIIGTPTYYAEGCFVTLTGTGKVTITGKKLNVTENIITQNYNVNGEDCTIKNELLTSQTDAIAYGTWFAGVLALKNEYSVENRGFPELDCTDKIYFETLFTQNLATIIVENVLEYSGTLSATTKVLIGE